MAFTGRAIYDVTGSDKVFSGLAEDVSDIVSMID